MTNAGTSDCRAGGGRRRPGLVIKAAALLLFLVAPAQPKRVVNKNGQCVYTWAPDSLLCGPIAIANAPFFPIRCPAELVLLEETHEGNDTILRIIVSPLAVVLGTIIGTFIGIASVTAGTAEVVTGGHFRIASDAWTTFTIKPLCFGEGEKAVRCSDEAFEAWRNDVSGTSNPE